MISFEVSNSETQLCDECGRSYNTIQALRKHKQFHAEPKFECSECGKKFIHKNRLKRHIPIHGLSSDKYVCNECGSEHSSEDAYYKHITKVHRRKDSDRKFACDQCELKFFIVSDLKAHQRSHTSIKRKLFILFN